MHFSTSTTLLALSASVASAAPWGSEGHHHWNSQENTTTVTVTATSAGQTPFVFPNVPNAFPTPGPQELLAIEQQAGGTLSDAPPPPFPGKDGITNLQLIAFNELFEVAFFTELIANITNSVPNYEVDAFTMKALKAVQGQEMLHVSNANIALKHFNVTPIAPCEYVFPVDNFPAAIALAGTFTDLVLGTLQDVQQIFAENSDAGLVRGIGAVIGQEGEQEGFYRILQDKLPSSAPFLTTSTRDFAFSALQSFILPGCAAVSQIPLKIFGPLNVLNAGELTNINGTAQFSVDPTKGPIDGSSSIVYISGQNLPVIVPITSFLNQGGVATFEASFPFQGGADGVGSFNDGLTIAAIVPGNTNLTALTSADAVANVATFGPGLIEIN